MRILVTGGAGFIGSHLVQELLNQKHEVRVLDSLAPQVHGCGAQPRLDSKVEFIRGDINDPQALTQALEGVDAAAHLAATVGVGQSMYQVTYYTGPNVNGTAHLYETIIKNRSRFPIKKVVVASSMSAYGEGLYECGACRRAQRGRPRSQQQLNSRRWELACPSCGKDLKPVGVPESEPFICESIYALTKRDTEEIALMLGASHKIPSIALRFFNVYGPGQSLSNPYTGVAAIFMSRVLNGKEPVVYEDGLQSRDLIHVRDIARAVRLALECDQGGMALNVGTGRPATILDVANVILRLAAPQSGLKPSVVQAYRHGDIRHCFADIRKIQEVLGWKPQVQMEDGFRELIEWSKTVKAVDHFDQAAKELERYGLLAGKK